MLFRRSAWPPPWHGYATSSGFRSPSRAPCYLVREALFFAFFPELETDQRLRSDDPEGEGLGHEQVDFLGGMMMITDGEILADGQFQVAANLDGALLVGAS